MALLERLRRRARWLWLALTMKPVMGGAPPDDPPKDDPPKDPPKNDPPKDPPKNDPPKDDPDPDDEPVKPDDDWQSKARKHERAAKRERKAREEAERKLSEREKADMSDQEKALDKAREEARAEAKTEADKERRADRLEVAVTRLASKGVKVGDGDDAKTVKFADSEDALLRIERGIRRGDIDEDEIYDSEGKVKTDALTTALAEIADANPHLVGDGTERRRSAGDADTRKGDPKQKDLEAMGPEDHAKRRYGTDK